MRKKVDDSWAVRLMFAACGIVWVACYFLASDRLQGLLSNSILLVLATLLVSMPVGIALAVAIAKTNLWGRRWLERALVVTLFVPLYVQATAWLATIGQGGFLLPQNMIAGFPGAVWVHGVAAIPWVTLFVTAALRRVPRELEEAALQDSSEAQVLVRVSLRHASYSIVFSALWIALICLSEISVTDLFQVRTFAEEIYTAASLGVLDDFQVQQSSSPPGATDIPFFSKSDLWCGTLCIATVVLAILIHVLKSNLVGDFFSNQTDWTFTERRSRSLWTPATWAILLLVIGLPTLGLIGKAGIQTSQVEGQAVQTWSATKVAHLVLSSGWQNRREFGWSIAIGALVTGLTVSTAIVIGWAIRSGHLSAWLTAGILSLLFAIPGPLLGIWVIRSLNQPPDSLLSPLAWCYDNTITAPVLVQFLRALPPTTLVLVSQFRSLPQTSLDSARSEGAGWFQQLHQIALPWCWPAVVVAIALVSIVSVGELAATLLVVPPGVSPLSVRIFGLIHYGADDRVSALCLFLIIALALGIAGVSRLFRIVPGVRNADQ